MQSTFDRQLLIDLVGNILWSLEQIRKRFSVIRTPEDFLKDDVCLEKLDSICMQIINIGEALKEIDKITKSQFLNRFDGVDWKKAKGMRDIITHHYFDIDAEIIFTACNQHLPEMESVMRRMINELEEGHQ
jgi:uncharacterized protein with HEPN domain